MHLLRGQRTRESEAAPERPPGLSHCEAKGLLPTASTMMRGRGDHVRRVSGSTP